MKEKKLPAGARDKMPFWFSSAWSLRAAAVATCTLLFGYATFYATDVLLLNPTTVGLLLLASKLFDGFTDLVIGYLIDKTNTRLGKARPYELAIIALWVFSFMYYSAPTGMSDAAKYVWIFVMYTMVNSIAITMLYGNEVAYLNRAVVKHENKVKVTALNGVYTIIISTVLSIAIPQFVAAAGVDPKGWSFLALAIAVPMTIIGLSRFFFCKEIQLDSEPVKLDIKEGASVIFKNKYIWIFGIMYFGYHFLNVLSGTAQTYYFQYEIGDLGFASFVGMGMFLVPFLLAFVPKLMSKFGTRNVLRAGIILIGLGPLMRMIFGTNPITLVVFSIVFLIGTVPVGFMSTVYVFECIDYGAWKTGKRVEAMIGAVNSFVAKVGQAFASAGAGLVMGLAGYEGALEVQSATTMTAIRGLYNVAPIVVAIIMLIGCHFYDVEKKLPEIRAELAQRQTEAEQEK